MAKFAAVGDDGTRPVVWGLGDTEAQARRDAEDQAYEFDCSTGILTLHEISDELARRIETGEIDAVALGIVAA